MGLAGFILQVQTSLITFYVDTDVHCQLALRVAKELQFTVAEWVWRHCTLTSLPTKSVTTGWHWVQCGCVYCIYEEEELKDNSCYCCSLSMQLLGDGSDCITNSHIEGLLEKGRWGWEERVAKTCLFGIAVGKGSMQSSLLKGLSACALRLYSYIAHSSDYNIVTQRTVGLWVEQVSICLNANNACAQGMLSVATAEDPGGRLV